MPTNAEQLLLQHWDGRLPVDPRAIAERLGVRVESEPHLWEDDRFGTPLSGKLDIDAHGQSVIAYASSEPLVRQRFTIAHELGHFVLKHGSRFRDPTLNFNSSNYDPKEAAANRFAAELLMPSALLERQLLAGVGDVAELARRFGVSEVAMKIRLKTLGWLS